jgi:tetratricopeptide (TPR) repeat protein
MRVSRLAWMSVALALAALVTSPLARAAGVEDGKRLAKERRWPQAAEAFAEALKSSPTSRDAALGLATAVAEGKLADLYDDATKAASAALKSKPDDREMRLAYGYLFLARAVLDERWRADAQEQFSRLLKANAEDDDATIGLARYHYFGGDYPRGLELLDALLVKKPTNGSAHFWRGMLLYDQAEQAAKAGMSPPVTAMFQKAADAFDASTKADPSRAEAWMRLAYACQYLAADPARAKQAEAAYLKALDADPGDNAPLRGLRSLLAATPERYAAVLEKLSKEKPRSAAVLYVFAESLKAQGKYDEAIEALKGHLNSARDPARGYFELAELLREKKNDAEGAKKAYEACLRAAPQSSFSETAVGWLTVPLQNKGRDAVASYEAAKALEKDYDAILSLSPKSMVGHNNIGFFLREAYKATGSKHRDLLDACVAHYIAASDVIGEFMPAYLSMAYPQRHGYAQIINDTGLMFQYQPEIKDNRMAEKYYRRAMEWTENGYWDSYGNLMKILDEEKRTQDALDFAEACAEGIKREDGSPQPDFRKVCEGDAARLKKLLGK